MFGLGPLETARKRIQPRQRKRIGLASQLGRTVKGRGYVGLSAIGYRLSAAPILGAREIALATPPVSGSPLLLFFYFC